jgi:hypothetical protein
MNQIHYESKAQKKRVEKQLEAESFLKTKKEQDVLTRWEQSQITAAGWQSVLDHAVGLYNEHKEELEEEVVTKTEQMIEERQSEIKNFLMKEKDLYLAAMEVMAD